VFIVCMDEDRANKHNQYLGDELNSHSRGHRLSDTSREAIYEIGGCVEGFIPKLEWYTSVSKKGETGFNNMTVLAFSRTFLLVGVGTRHKMNYAHFGEELIMKFLIFPTLTRLNTFNLSVKKAIDMSLKN
jgi:hypothetical protein